MKILITNDDGINSENLRVLVKAVVKHYPNDEIVIVAPEVEQSGVSHAIDIKNPVHIYRKPDMVENVKTYMVDSTPVACVLMAKNELKYDFDILFSGINNGLNIGIDVLYSGTCGAALEGLRFCNFTVAFSCNMDTVKGFIAREDEVFKIIKNNNFKGICLNVNFPQEPIGIKVTCQENNNPIIMTDTAAINKNYVSITPLKIDITDYDKIALLQTIIQK